MKIKLVVLIWCCVVFDLVSCVRNSSLKVRWCGTTTDRCINAVNVYCNDLTYRSFDGSCNNPYNPTLGMAFTVYNRLLPSNYGDNIYSMPLSKMGGPLPSARRLSTQVFGRKPISDPEFTVLNMQWGQLVTNDVSLRMPDGFPGLQPLEPKLRRCCTGYGRFEIRNTTNPCFPIPVPKNDPFFRNRHCIDFERSVTDKDQKCPGTQDPTPAEQINGVTHFMDLSNVYGNSEEQSDELRDYHAGLLLTSGNSPHWPPQARDQGLHCALGNPGNKCYEFGDVRGNQNVGLVILQTVMMREHNRLASELAIINPHWDDDILYQEARRINIAQYQYITYYEWSPNFYGEQIMFENGLMHNTTADGYVNGYDPCIDPRSLQSAMHASFRYFHNQIVGHYQLFHESRQQKRETLALTEFMDRPGILEENGEYSNLVRGLCTQHAALTDKHYDPEATDHFIIGAGSRGFDLRTYDIQRDRDHGLPRYNAFREYCGLKRATSWHDYLDHISEEDVKLLKMIYKSYEDVDLSIGGALEKHVMNTLVGPTFLCINLIQFDNLRSGDQYFFENGDQPYPFTPEQLVQIRKASAARLICDNADVDSMQPQAFKAISKQNILKPCSNLPKLDLSFWKEYAQR